jgi:hypothetical protein
MIPSGSSRTNRRNIPLVRSFTTTTWLWMANVVMVVLLSNIFVVPLFTVTQIPLLVNGLPSGAAGCDCCSSAALGFHTDYGPTSASGRTGRSSQLSTFNTIFTIQNMTMVPGMSTQFPGGVELNWTVQATAELPFRGILVRVEPTQPFVDFTVTGDANLWEARSCFAQTGNVEGITHRSRIQKQNATGTFRFDRNGPVSIDVNVVYSNGRVAPGNTSVYAYNGFSVMIVNSPPVAPVAPVVVPTAPLPAPPDVCTTNQCGSFLGIQKRRYNKFFLGTCHTKCSLPFFAFEFLGWRCGGCF